MRWLLLALGAVTLSGCASADYGYAYCYDPYLGPTGYHYGPLERKPACVTPPAHPAAFASHENGYRGPYVSGPHPGPVATAPVDAATPAGVR